MQRQRADHHEVAEAGDDGKQERGRVAAGQVEALAFQ